MNFQRLVIIVAMIIIILMLTFVGYILHKDKKNMKFPPVIGDCPDYWISENNLCINPHKIGPCLGPIDFSTTLYQGDNGNCEKSKKARNCKLSWQGITDNENICNN